MSTIQSQDWDPDPEWPVAAIPQRWVETLFATMSATYGARFADLWRGTNIAQVKRHWGAELAKLTAPQMKAGRDNLMALPKPPTLPEFLALCRQARMEAASQAVPKLEDLPKMSPEEAARNIGAVRNVMKKMRQPIPTAEWAFKAYEGIEKKPFKVQKDIKDAITSPAGVLAVNSCIDPGLKARYAEIRQMVVGDYQMRGLPLWGTQ